MRKPNAIPGGGAMPLDRAKNAVKAQSLIRQGHALANGDAKVKKKKPTAEAFQSQKSLNAIQNQRRKRGETSSLKGGLTHGLTVHPYDGGTSEQTQTGTSIFDPVLCELAYRWFCPVNGKVLDPFAGGSVRGIVASILGLNYTGVDLSGRQVAANIEQAKRICDPSKQPRWIVGNSQEIPTLIGATDMDLVFSCPPYFDLEVYSEDPNDLSTMSWAKFLEAYRIIIAGSVACLRDNRFAVFVVGDIRDQAGLYRNFVSETIRAFQDAGAMLYNEGILVTAVGSLPVRAGRQFGSGRKLGKTHQNILVFYKGNPANIKKEFPQEIEFGEIQAQSD